MAAACAEAAKVSAAAVLENDAQLFDEDVDGVVDRLHEAVGRSLGWGPESFLTACQIPPP